MKFTKIGIILTLLTAIIFTGCSLEEGSISESPDTMQVSDQINSEDGGTAVLYQSKSGNSFYVATADTDEELLAMCSLADEEFGFATISYNEPSQTIDSKGTTNYWEDGVYINREYIKTMYLGNKSALSFFTRGRNFWQSTIKVQAIAYTNQVASHGWMLPVQGRCSFAVRGDFEEPTTKVILRAGLLNPAPIPPKYAYSIYTKILNIQVYANLK